MNSSSNQTYSIAVIIPVYNRERYILEALSSVDRQTRTPDEVIVVDDGSSDRSVELVSSWKPKFAPRPRIIRQANQGASAARNTAISSSQADLIAPLDSDDVFLPAHLSLLESAFCQVPKLVACAGNSGRLDDLHHFKKTGFDQSVFNGVECVVQGDLRVVQGSPYTMMLGGAFIPTCSSMFSRTAAVDCGLFDESLRTCEDTDFWLRMSRHGQFGFFMQEIALVRKHDENLTHRRHITSHITSRICTYEKMIRMADELSLTKDELSATRQVLAHQVSGAVNRASRYGVRPYLNMCRELIRRGYWGKLIQVRPLLRALVYPQGNSPKLKRMAKSPGTS